jgi:hypothetical protein
MEQAVELLLVEDNPTDVELTLHVLKKYNLANRIQGPCPAESLPRKESSEKVTS